MKNILHIIIVFNLLFSAPGYSATNSSELQTHQMSCPLPPPSAIWANVIGSDFISLEWSPVAGAVQYQIVVTELNSTIPAQYYYSSSNNILISGLNPLTQYKFEVSASACLKGPYGNSNYIIEWLTGIVITLVESGLRCTPTLNYENKNSNSETTFEILESIETLYLNSMFEGNNKQQFVVECEFKPGFENALVINYIKEDYIIFDQIDSKTLDVKFNNSSAQTEFKWLRFFDVEVTGSKMKFKIFFYESCQFYNEICGVQNRSTPSTHPSPNPFSTELHLEKPELAHTPTTAQLLNASGQPVRQSKSTSGVFDFHTDLLPAGLYYIKIQSEAGSETHKVIKIE